MNPIMQTLLSSRLGPIKQMMGVVQAAQNPALALQQMAGQNPQLQQAKTRSSSRRSNLSSRPAEIRRPLFKNSARREA